MPLNSRLDRVMQLALMKERGEELPFPEPLQRYTIMGRSALLHAPCAEGFRADRRAGLIYGPYRVTDPVTRQERWARDAEEASVLGQFCPYCGGS